MKRPDIARNSAARLIRLLDIPVPATITEAETQLLTRSVFGSRRAVVRALIKDWARGHAIDLELRVTGLWARLGGTSECSGDGCVARVPYNRIYDTCARCDTIAEREYLAANPADSASKCLDQGGCGVHRTEGAVPNES